MIKWAKNTGFTGKAPKGKDYLYSQNWENQETTLEDWFIEVVGNGHAYCAEMKSEGICPKKKTVVQRNNGRATHFFKSHQILGVDIDHGMTVDELLNDNFYQDFGCGYYTTPSHKSDDPRFRIIFVLETAITDPDDMTMLYIAFINKYGGDASGKDPCRLFCGAVNPEFADFRPDVIVPNTVINCLLNTTKKKQEALANVGKIRAALIDNQYKNRPKTSNYNRENFKMLVESSDKPRDVGLFKIASVMHHEQIPLAQALEDIAWLATNRCQPPFDIADAQKKVRTRYGQ